MVTSYGLNTKNTFLFFLFISLSHITIADTNIVRMVYVGSENSNAYLGVKQGIKEANIQGQFLGRNYILERLSPDDVDHDFSKYIAIFSANNKKTFITLTKKASNIPVFNLNLDDNNLRDLCSNNAFHVVPSNKMKVDAVEKWQLKTKKEDVNAKAWHHDFVKYAARDLNKRFKENWGKPMDDYAWSGWAAVKLLSDTLIRESFKSSNDMLTYLKSDLVFDGQKGSRMNFKKNGQLLQPILLIKNNKIVAESPIANIIKQDNIDSVDSAKCIK